MDKEALIRILKEPKNSLIKQYKKLFEIDGVELEFEDDAVEDTLPTSYEKIRKSKGYFIDYTMICEQINTLTENNCMQDSAVIINKMKKIISYFSRINSG